MPRHPRSSMEDNARSQAAVFKHSPRRGWEQGRRRLLEAARARWGGRWHRPTRGGCFCCARSGTSSFPPGKAGHELLRRRLQRHGLGLCQGLGEVRGAELPGLSLHRVKARAGFGPRTTSPEMHTDGSSNSQQTHSSPEITRLWQQGLVPTTELPSREMWALAPQLQDLKPLLGLPPQPGAALLHPEAFKPCEDEARGYSATTSCREKGKHQGREAGDERSLLFWTSQMRATALAGGEKNHQLLTDSAGTKQRPEHVQ